jgi:geranylgeranyl diphosphate synthase type II
VRIEDRLIERWRGVIDSELLAIFPPNDVGAARGQCNDLTNACRYVSEGGGKRLRGLLVLSVAHDLLWGAERLNDLTASALGDRWSGILSAATALELLHVASLVHDDLPAIDNDDMRRGRAACHRAFGEGAAILAGDGLIGRAFMVVTGSAGLSSDNQARIVRLLSKAWWDLCCGQQMDLEQRANPNPEVREQVMRLKTGALFGAALGCGAICGGVSEAKLDKYIELGINVGVVFQSLDDLADGDVDSSRVELVRCECRNISHLALPSLDARLSTGVSRGVLGLVFEGVGV